jgi:2,3-dihydroxybenzoate-AMP ligase
MTAFSITQYASLTLAPLAWPGPYTLRGYYGVPEYNARAFTSDGFYRSGDLMRLHPSGNYMVEGRKQDLINRGGEEISAEEIENLILTHPAVQNVACVPMPDPVGERMCAYAILREGHNLTLGELVTFLMKEEIAKHNFPSVWRSSTISRSRRSAKFQKGSD